MTDCCIKCGNVFPANRDLVAVPNGRSLVVDRANGHAWRVCGKCAEWELLGPERSGALIAELTARLPHFMRDEAMHHDAVGGTTVVVLPASPDAPVRSELGVQRRKLHSYSRPLVVAMYAVAATIMVGTALTMMWLEEGALPLGGLLQLAKTMAAPYVGIALGTIMTHRLVGVTAPRPLVVATVGGLGYLLVGAALFPTMSTLTLELGLIATVVTITSVLKFAMDWIGTRIRLPGGKSAWIQDVASRMLQVDLVGESVVVRGLRKGAVAVGEDAAVVLDHVMSVQFGRLGGTDIDAGWLLLRQHGDLATLVKVLLELRPDDAGGVVWYQISGPWQAALGLAAAEATGKTAESRKLLARLPKESAVAALARGLVTDGEGDR